MLGQAPRPVAACSETRGAQQTRVTSAGATWLTRREAVVGSQGLRRTRTSVD